MADAVYIRVKYKIASVFLVVIIFQPDSGIVQHGLGSQTTDGTNGQIN